MTRPVTWTQEATIGKARAGVLSTPHGAIPTPGFMPVGTRGTVKGVDAADLRSIGVQMVLANTYHLMLRPGADTVAALGELHGFMAWDGPILTDSGGYQVFSLDPALRVPEEQLYYRYEDTIVITETGFENFTDFLPMELDDIEALMREEGVLLSLIHI